MASREDGELPVHAAAAVLVACSLLLVLLKAAQWRSVRLLRGLLKKAGIDLEKHICFIGDEHSVLAEWCSRGSLGIAESYVRGEWTTARGPLRLKDFYLRLQSLPSADVRRMVRSPSVYFAAAAVRLLPARFNNIGQSRRDVSSHYDKGNELYAAFLDRTLTYSCAYWSGLEEGKEATLEKAQVAKVRLIAAKLQLQPGMTVLDIGCGWGHAAWYMAEHHGVHVLGITLSAEQIKVAKQRKLSAASRGSVEFLYMDYRELLAARTLERGSGNAAFDRVFSVGMLEHVGRAFYPAYYEAVASLLKPDGLMLVHTIGTMRPMKRMDAFMLKHIFPNAHIPSQQELADAACAAGWVTEDLQNFGPDYSKTLDAWLRNYTAAVSAERKRLAEATPKDGTAPALAGWAEEEFARMCTPPFPDSPGSWHPGWRLCD